MKKLGDIEPEVAPEAAPEEATTEEVPRTAKQRLKDLTGRVFGWVNGPTRAAAFALLVAMVVFFGRDVVSSFGVRGDIRELRRQKRELEAKIAADSTLLRNLDDPEFLERYARERYLMRREGETVYVIKE